MEERKIIKIDEEKCNGCGLCVPNCHEGALRIIDGKARLVSEVFCDGLGACIGHCPQGAITIEERNAAPFSEDKVREHMAKKSAPSGCPGSRVMDLRNKKSELRQWPVQIKLVPTSAAYLDGADLLISADCVPFVFPAFHKDLLKGKVLLVGCPKLDDLEYYREKISGIVKHNNIKSITYAHMEVPCCSGFIGIIEHAISGSLKDIPFKDVTISIEGEKLT